MINNWSCLLPLDDLDHHHRVSLSPSFSLSLSIHFLICSLSMNEVCVCWKLCFCFHQNIVFIMWLFMSQVTSVCLSVFWTILEVNDSLFYCLLLTEARDSKAHLSCDVKGFPCDSCLTCKDIQQKQQQQHDVLMMRLPNYSFLARKSWEKEVGTGWTAGATETFLLSGDQENGDEDASLCSSCCVSEEE